MSCVGASPYFSLQSVKRLVPFLAQSVLFLLILNILPANAQDLAGLEQGIKPYGSYEGGNIDSISMANGNLTLHIPLISFPQRGGRLHLGFSIVYTNPVYTLTFTPDTNGGHQCSYAGCYVWSMSTQGGLIKIVPDVPTVSEVWEPYCTGVCILQNYKVVDPDGAVHQMGMTAANNSLWRSMDTSGFAYGAGSPTLIDREGTRYDFSTANGYPYPVELTQIEDVNGNLITVNFNTEGQPVSYTDSMGRTIPNSPVSASTAQCPSGAGLQTATSADTWSFPGPNGATSIFTVCYAAFPLNYTSICNGYSSCAGLTGTTPAVQSIILPNGMAWNFAVDTTGALSQITLPTGGTISYTWGQNYYCTAPANNVNGLVAQFTHNALSRTVNDGTGPHTWDYALSPTTTGTGHAAQTIVTDPYLNDSVHTLSVIGQGCSLYETGLEEYSGSHTTGSPLRQTVTAYSSNGTYESFLTIPLALNVVPTSITTTDMAVSGGKSSQTTKSWDSGVALTGSEVAIIGDLLTKKEYLFNGGLGRTTNNTYMALVGPNASSYLANNLLDLPYTVQVQDGSSNQMSLTQYNYDETARASSGLGSAYQFDSAPPAGTYRGNNTSILRWLNSGSFNCPNGNSGGSGSNIISKLTYFDDGMLNTSADPCGDTTTYTYSLSDWGAFPTTITNALGQPESYAYDFNTGAVTSFTDLNSQPTTYQYDVMARPTLVSYPDGGSTSYCYTDASTCTPTGPANSVVVTKAISSTLNETSTLVFDGLGRPSQTQLTSDPSGTDYIETTYDGLGRKATISNAHRSSSSTTDGITTYSYDALSRVTAVAEQDGSVVKTTYDQTNTNSPGLCTTVTDEAGNARQSCVNALGATINVFEDPGLAPHLNYSTTYQYDALNNLLNVAQTGTGNTRTRSFTYESLSRLVCAANPEIQAVTCPTSATSPSPTGAITYAYDPIGNVTTKTAPSPNQSSTGTATVVTNYTFDALNRLKGKTYTDSYPGNPATPTVKFGYDGVALTGCTPAPPGDTDSYPLGRRTAMCDGSGATSWKHDTMGRILQERRTIGAALGEYDTDVYNLNGTPTSVATLGYSVAYSYDGAGRPLTVANYTGGTNKIVSGAVYAPTGQLTAMTNGSATGFTGIVTSNAYNNRLQPILLSAAVAGQNPVFSLCFNFQSPTAVTTPTPCTTTAGSGDNGNVYQIVNNRNSNRSDSFTYDSLNRILNGQSSGSQWGESYTIDAWGNMYQIGSYNSKPHESFSTTVNPNNQLVGFGYDAAGNMTSNGSTSYVYDAGDRLIWSSGGYRYLYDGDGQRVEKCAAASATTACPTSGTNGTLYWRGLGGDPLSETDLAGNVVESYVFFNGQRVARRDASTNALHYYFSDHLGSHGVVENATATTCEQDIDYFPYGGVQTDYCAVVPQNYKFTGKERDSESGLDNFGARYNASSMGRFMSPDAKMPSVRHLVNPQKWNKYAYTINNPLRYFDPDGMEEKEVQLRAYIQAKSVSDPAGRTFAGDNRGSTSAQNVTSRTSITVRIETDPSIRPGNPIISQTSSAGTTKQVDANGNVVNSATATQGLPTATGSRDANGNPVLNIQQDAKNPLEPQSLTPGISSNLNITVGGSSVTTAGTVSGTPSFELNVSTAGGADVNVPLQTEPSGMSFGLGLFQTNSILNVTPLPPTPPPCAQNKGSGCNQ